MARFQDVAQNTCFLHLGTPRGLGAIISLDQLVENESLQVPRWQKVVDDLREQYDLNHDLEGQTVVRIWGLASHRGVSAVLLSRHPADMVEYQIASSEATTIGFAMEGPGNTADIESLHGVNSPSSGHSRWEEAMAFLLSQHRRSLEDEAANQKLIYAAACCALLGGASEAIRAQSQQTFDHLAAVTGANLSEEMEKCGAKSPEISAKSSDCFSQPGAHLFEWCEICDAGIAWSSTKEAQCVEGHLFSTKPVCVRFCIVLILSLARCGLSSLTIQEPGISKYCSVCRAEYMDNELIAASPNGQISSLFTILSEAFDTCLFCDGKFERHV